jgi:hypothetical protein
MGNCVNRELEDPQVTHINTIESTLTAAGWNKVPSSSVNVITNTTQVTAVHISSNRVYMQLRLNSAVLESRIYEKLYKHLMSRKYKPIAVYSTGHSEFMFLRAIVEKPCSLVVDLQSSRDKLLPTSAKVFLGVFAICVVPEGVAFLRAELQDIIVVKWAEKLSTVGLSYCSDETHGVVVSLADKGIFKLCFRYKGIESETYNAHQVVKRLEMGARHSYSAFLEAIEDRGLEAPSDLHSLLRLSSPQFEPRWARISPTDESMWWVRESPTEKVLVIKYDGRIHVLAVDAAVTKYIGVFER